MSAAAGGSRSPREIAQRFAFTLVPIAIGYHLAHYLVFLLVQGQYIIPLISDPFGWGWDLFGTAGYRVDIAVIGARFAWYTAVVAILVGPRDLRLSGAHCGDAVFEPRRRDLAIPDSAHRADGRLHLHQPFDSRRADRRTARAGTSVGDRNRRHRHSGDAVLPEPGTGRLQPVGPDKFAKSKLTYRVLGSAFHDGTKTSVADLLYAYMFAYRWGTQSDASNSHYDPHRRFRDRSHAPAACRIAGDRKRRSLEVVPHRRCQLRSRAVHDRGLCNGRSRRP